MLEWRVAHQNVKLRFDQQAAITGVLGFAVVALSAAVAVMLYLPLR